MAPRPSAMSTQNAGFFISHTFSEAWQTYKKEWLKLIGLALLPMLVGFVYGALTENMEGGLALVVGVIYFVFQLMLGMGVTRSLIKIGRGQEIGFDTFKSSLSSVGRYFVASLLYGLIVVGGLLLFIVPGVIWAVKYMYMPYLVIDEDLGPLAAMKKSSQMTQGIKWDLWAFSFTAAIYSYLGVLLLVVGLLITLPVAMLSTAMVYNQALRRWQKSHA